MALHAKVKRSFDKAWETGTNTLQPFTGNRFFDDAQLEILLTPWKWSLVTSFMPPDIAPVDDPAYRRWMKQHVRAFPRRAALICLRGETLQGCGGQIYPCAPGSVFFFDTYEQVTVGYPKNTPDFQHFWMILHQSEIHGCLNVGQAGEVTQPRDTICLLTPELNDLAFQEIRSWAKGGPPVPPSVTRLRLIAILAEFVAKMLAAGYGGALPRDRAARQRQQIDAVRRHALQAWGKGMSIDYLTSFSGLSKFHLQRLFKKYSGGMTIHHYINVCRVRRVQELIARGYSMKAISVELGFSTPANFSRWYSYHKPAKNAEPVL